MSETEGNSVDRLLEILADEAAFGLGADQEHLLKSIPDDLSPAERDEMMKIAGLTQLSFLKIDAPACQEMPEHLREKILTKADEFFARQFATSNAGKVVELNEFRTANEAKKLNESQQRAPRGNINTWIGWSVAAALLIALVVNQSGFRGTLETPASSIARQRVDLLNETRDAIQVPWQETADFQGAGIDGDVVWSNSTQQGFLRLAGLPANDPAISQYQLWIVDPDRDANPVDGGVFDVASNDGETIIRIDAKLNVKSPAAFAVTREKPGGVVVSAGPLLIVAAVKS